MGFRRVGTGTHRPEDSTLGVAEPDGLPQAVRVPGAVGQGQTAGLAILKIAADGRQDAPPLLIPKQEPMARGRLWGPRPLSTVRDQWAPRTHTPRPAPPALRAGPGPPAAARGYACLCPRWPGEGVRMGRCHPPGNQGVSGLADLPAAHTELGRARRCHRGPVPRQPGLGRSGRPARPPACAAWGCCWAGPGSWAEPGAARAHSGPQSRQGPALSRFGVHSLDLDSKMTTIVQLRDVGADIIVETGNK